MEQILNRLKQFGSNKLNKLTLVGIQFKHVPDIHSCPNLALGLFCDKKELNVKLKKKSYNHKAVAVDVCTSEKVGVGEDLATAGSLRIS